MTTPWEDAPGARPAHDREPGAQHPSGPSGLKEVLAGIERDLILTALHQSHGNKAKAARALGISQRLMGIRVKRLGIDWRGLRKRRPTNLPEG